MNLKLLLVPVLLLSVFLVFGNRNSEKDKESIYWVISELVELNESGTLGTPDLLDCKYGKAVRFDGKSDGILLDEMPLKNLENFTVEAVFYPESGGDFEQRFLHLGEVFGDRFLFEIRSTAGGWYFDSFIKSGENKKALIDLENLYPSDQWYHVAFVCENGKLKTFVNKKLELEDSISFNPLTDGKTSIGVRQNQQSWFKGAIYSIRISPFVLMPSQFINR